MSRTPFYLMTLETMTTPATVKEVCEQARQLFGPQVSARQQSVRFSLERFALMGIVLKIPDGNGKFRYATSQHESNSRTYLEKRITELETDLIKMRAALADLKSACNAQPACYDAPTPTPNEA